MIIREAGDEIIKELSTVPVVGLLGPRQMGKTTLAWQIAQRVDSEYLDLENSDDVRSLGANPAHFFEKYRNKLVILDEIQSYPDLFKVIRGVIDSGRKEGRANHRFLVLGSAQGELLNQSSQNLSGRISYLQLGGFSPTEVKKSFPEDPDLLTQLWLRGGFPDSYLAHNEKESLLWRLRFISTYLSNYIFIDGKKITHAKLRHFWELLATYQGCLWNPSTIASELKVKGKIVEYYKNIMEDLFLLRSLPPYSHSFNQKKGQKKIKKEIIKSSKIYLRDSGLLHALLDIDDQNELFSHVLMGASWEGYVIEKILSRIPSSSPGIKASFYRSESGDEVDLIIRFRRSQLWVIEIKASSDLPTLKSGFYQALEFLEPTQAFTIYRGPRKTNHLGVIFLSLMEFLDVFDEQLSNFIINI